MWRESHTWRDDCPWRGYFDVDPTCAAYQQGVVFASLQAVSEARQESSYDGGRLALLCGLLVFGELLWCFFGWLVLVSTSSVRCCPRQQQHLAPPSLPFTCRRWRAGSSSSPLGAPSSSLPPPSFLLRPPSSLLRLALFPLLYPHLYPHLCPLLCPLLCLLLCPLLYPHLWRMDPPSVLPSSGDRVLRN